MKKNRRLTESYKFPGFQAYQKVKGIFGDQQSLIITIKRVQKKQYVQSVLKLHKVFMIGKQDWFGIYLAEINVFFWKLRYVESTAGDAKK